MKDRTRGRELAAGFSRRSAPRGWFAVLPRRRGRERHSSLGRAFARDCPPASLSTSKAKCVGFSRELKSALSSLAVLRSFCSTLFPTSTNRMSAASPCWSGCIVSGLRPASLRRQANASKPLGSEMPSPPRRTRLFFQSVAHVHTCQN